MSERIVTHVANDAYRDGFDAIFGKKECETCKLAADADIGEKWQCMLHPKSKEVGNAGTK